MTTLHSSLTGTELHKPFNSGLDANKAASPTVNDWYYATDTYKLYYCAVAAAWLEAPLGTVFYDRGDPAAVDYSKADFTIDSGWHDLNLSAIVPAGTKSILFEIALQSAVLAIKYFEIRKNGNSNIYNRLTGSTQVADVPIAYQGWVACDTNRVVEYYASAESGFTWTIINVVIKGWLK